MRTCLSLRNAPGDHEASFHFCFMPLTRAFPKVASLIQYNTVAGCHVIASLCLDTFGTQTGLIQPVDSTFARWPALPSTLRLPALKPCSSFKANTASLPRPLPATCPHPGSSTAGHRASLSIPLAQALQAWEASILLLLPQHQHGVMFDI